MAATFQIRPTAPADLPDLLRLEEASFSDPWSAEALRQSLSGSGAVHGVAVAPSGEMVGAAMGRVTLDEAELLSIAVLPSLRGQGIGRQLLAWIMAEFMARGAASIWLEVRAGNEAAQALYRTAGFQLSGRRRGYYRHPHEDALVLSWRPPAATGTSVR